MSGMHIEGGFVKKLTPSISAIQEKYLILRKITQKRVTDKEKSTNHNPFFYTNGI
ncbi:MAG: hypothetical protein K2L93_06850 [Muribaculaceae bacterium]|nr:hypothetical protein [Muribaculaceae bacterium]